MAKKNTDSKKIGASSSLNQDFSALGASLKNIGKEFIDQAVDLALTLCAFLRACGFLAVWYLNPPANLKKREFMAFAAGSDDDRKMIEVLIELFGFSVDETDPEKDPPAYWAIIRGRSENLATLIHYNADKKAVMAKLCLESNGPEYLAQLDDYLQKIMIESIDLDGPPDSHGDKFVHQAVRYNRLSWLKQMAGRGADLREKNGNGDTLLHLACASQDSDLPIIDWLIQQGLDVNACNNEGLTPLMMLADWYGPRQDLVAQLLLKAGADPCLKNSGGSSALQLFCSNKNYMLIKLLLKNKRVRDGINEKNNYGFTALHQVLGGRLVTRRFMRLPEDTTDEIVKMLLKAGADPKAVSQEGDTPLHFAAAMEYPKAAKILMEAGADITAKNKDGATPLAVAIFAGSSDTLKLLLPQEWYGLPVPKQLKKTRTGKLVPKKPSPKKSKAQ